MKRRGTITCALLCVVLFVLGMFACSDDSSPSSGSVGCTDFGRLPSRTGAPLYDTPPVLITRVEPVYPRIAQQAGLTGTVKLAILVDRCGEVREIQVDSSSGYTVFDEAATWATQHWKYEPAQYHFRPVAMWTTDSVVFKLPE